MSIQEYMTNPYVGYFFMFGPISAYISILIYAIYKDTDECRKYITFKVVSGSWNEFWGPNIVMGILTAIAPFGWVLILVLTWHIYKDGLLRPGSYLKVAKELNDANERIERLERTCDEYRGERIMLSDRCERLEDDIRSYRWHIESLTRNRGQVAERRVAENVNHKRLIMQIEQEIDKIKRTGSN